MVDHRRMTRKIRLRHIAIQKTGDAKPTLNPPRSPMSLPCTLNEDHPFAARSMKADEQLLIIVIATARCLAGKASSARSDGGLPRKQSQPTETV
eukprot:Skav222729  [mRNA]  locus=scaffold2390:196510:197303:- [translate_table: standard]